MSLALQLPSSLTVGPLAPYKSCVSHPCVARACTDCDPTIWYFILFYFTEGVKRTRENPQESLNEAKVPKGCTRVKHRKLQTGLSDLEHSKSETSWETQEPAQTCSIDNSWFHNGWRYDEWNDDWSSVGRHEGCEQTYDNSASSLSLGSLDLGATSCPKRFEWVKMNLDTGAAVKTCPLNFCLDGAGDGRFCRTARGEWIPDGGAWRFQGYDENGSLRSLNGRLTGVHRVLCSAAGIACKRRQDFYLGHDGGYMIPIHNKIGQRMRTHVEKNGALAWKERTHSRVSRKQHFQFST